MSGYGPFWHRPDLRPGFETALAHARAWHAEHGHLAVPRGTRHDGYPLGAWLFSQRNRAKQRARASLPPSPHLAELATIDPWWNPPWDTAWHCNYHRALNHIAAGKPFDPTARVPAPSTVLGTWITRACLQYRLLHPGQQRLLNAIGITTQTASHWPHSTRPGPTPRPSATPAHGPANTATSARRSRRSTTASPSANGSTGNENSRRSAAPPPPPSRR
ncbi:helicase associated domain-containing protein [Streptomyces sp. NPDC086554]|uniref:helicase associated domain-containing protein n=1 Tax=Streptomyces sp. NPDC086554 TaxID=3154864 RepID=UPI00341604FD